LFFIPLVCVGAAIFVGGYLMGYEQRSKEEEQESRFWEEVEKYGI
jgi:hypothetical protein